MDAGLVCLMSLLVLYLHWLLLNEAFHIDSLHDEL